MGQSAFVVLASLIPFSTGWMGNNDFAPCPVALYGILLLLSGLAYSLLVWSLIIHHGKESPVAKAIGRDLKGKASLVIHTIGIPMSFVSPWIACALYIVVALLWLNPDPRIEQTFSSEWK